MNNPLATHSIAALPPQYDFINSKTLAQRWCLPESWVREQVRSRSTDPLPHIRFGKYVRFLWGGPELLAWAERRMVGPTNTAEKNSRKKMIQ